MEQRENSPSLKSAVTKMQCAGTLSVSFPFCKAFCSVLEQVPHAVVQISTFAHPFSPLIDIQRKWTAWTVFATSFSIAAYEHFQMYSVCLVRGAIGEHYFISKCKNCRRAWCQQNIRPEPWTCAPDYPLIPQQGAADKLCLQKCLTSDMTEPSLQDMCIPSFSTKSPFVK